MFQEYISELKNQGDITDEDAELYLYGWKELKNRGFNILVVLTVGLLTHSVIELLCLFVLFLLLRSFSGGYHAPTAGICFVCSVGLLFLAAMVLPDLKLNTMSHILFVLSTGIVLWLSPVEAINKPLDEKEHCVYRRISILLALIYAACYVLSAWLHIPVLQNAVWFAMCIQAIMLMFGRLLLFLTAKQNPA